MRSRHVQNGFTLIELLVVISIIALMIAILLPALRQAREAARRAVCGANARQIAMAITNYAEDNEGWHPRVQWSFANAFQDVEETMSYYLGGPSARPEVLLCPSHDPRLQDDYAHGYGGTTYRIVAARGDNGTVAESFTKGGGDWYGWHNAAGWSSWDGSDLRVLPRQQLLKNHVPSDYPMLADAHHWKSTHMELVGTHFFGAAGPLVNNHQDGSNVAFADGHVSFRHRDNFTKFIQFHNQGEKSRLRW